MKTSWSKSVVPIAALFSFRMLGLFMLIPIFTIYATQLEGATPTLVGVALGSYGLSQGLLQIPFGLFSDRFGRKKIITLGLILFACGSLIGAWTNSIYGMVFARTLQGTGAIGSVLIALMADLTSDNQRTKAMALIGASIGMSFSIAMIISPIIALHFGLSGIFYLTSVLAFLGLILLHTVIPSPKKEPFHPDSEVNVKLFFKVLKNRKLQGLNLGIFCQHFILTATFYCIPLLLKQQIEEGNITESWHFYLPIMLGSFLLMLPILIWGEKKKKMKILFVGAILCTSLCQLLFFVTYTYWLALSCMLFFYLLAFNALEASLPSLISRQAPVESKGTAMGIYSSSQFLGIFAGGTLAGLIAQYAGFQSIFLFNACLALIWLIATRHMEPNEYQMTLMLSYDKTKAISDTLIQELESVPGVHEVIISSEEALLYIRVNKALYVEGSAQRVLMNICAHT